MISPCFLALWLAAPSIASNSNCPSSQAIADQLSVLLPEAAARPGSALVVTLPERLLVDLRPDDALGAAQRTVEVGNDCDERARAAAVLIATWWPADRNETPRPQAPSVDPGPKGPRLDLSVGVLASAVSDGVVPGARAELSVHGQRLGGRVSLSATTAHAVSLGRGQVEWRRIGGEVGPSYEAAHLRGDFGLVAGLLHVQGADFQNNRGATAISVGATAGLRFTGSWGGVRSWVEARTIWWPLSQRTYVTDQTMGTQTSHDLPRGEVQLAAGTTFSLL